MNIVHREETGLAIPANPVRAVREIGSAWTRFVESGELSGSAPRPAIAHRWRQSRALVDINPLMERAPEGITHDEIQEILGREDLGRAGRKVLDDSARAVAGTGHVILLADDQGRIVYSAGHAGLQQTLDRLNLAPGASWAESAVGPNGIGTPIALGRPETIFGPEHYCRGWQPWVCFGCPVTDPEDGRVLGGVDITGPARRAHPFAFALTLSIAGSIEQLLMVLSLQRRQLLLDAFRALEHRWPGDPILVVSKSGRMVGVNGHANRVFGLASSDDSPALLRDVAPEIWSSLRQAIERGVGGEEMLTLSGPSAAAHALTCRIDPISRDGQAIGSAIVLTDGSGAGGRPPAASGGGRRVPADLAVRLRGHPRRRAGAPCGPEPRPGRGPGAPPQAGPHRRARAAPARSWSPAPSTTGVERAHGPVRRGQLRRAARGADRERAVRARAGRVHRRAARQAGGLFDAADGGTLFLDEVGEMPFGCRRSCCACSRSGEIAPARRAPRVIGRRARRRRDQPRPAARGSTASFREDLFYRLA